MSAQSQKGAKLGGEQPLAAGYPLARPPVSLFSNSVLAASISSVSSSAKWAYKCVPSEALGKTQWTGGPPGPREALNIQTLPILCVVTAGVPAVVRVSNPTTHLVTPANWAAVHFISLEGYR